MVRPDEIRLEMKILESVWVPLIVEKMVKNTIRWFMHLERRYVDYVVRRVNHK